MREYYYDDDDYDNMGKIGFIAEHLFWGLISWIWYKSILFRCIGTMSFFQSKMILLAMLLISTVSGIAFQFKRRRKGINVFFNLIFAYGLYAACTYIDIRPVPVIIGLAAAGVMILVVVAAAFTKEIKNKDDMFVIILKRFIRVMTRAKQFFSVSLACVMLVLSIGFISGSSILAPEVKPSKSDEYEGQTFDSNVDTMLMLYPRNWKGLSVQERLNVLQTVANIECTSLGLPTELNVGAANLNEHVLGAYNDMTHEILISLDSLINDSSWELLDTVCHEAYHAYQHRLIDCYNSVDHSSRRLKGIRDAKIYAEEFSEYVDGDDDLCGYYTQSCEADARTYAVVSVRNYHAQIMEYFPEDYSECQNEFDIHYNQNSDVPPPLRRRGPSGDLPSANLPVFSVGDTIPH